MPKIFSKYMHNMRPIFDPRRRIFHPNYHRQDLSHYTRKHKIAQDNLLNQKIMFANDSRSFLNNETLDHHLNLTRTRLGHITTALNEIYKIIFLSSCDDDFFDFYLDFNLLISDYESLIEEYQAFIDKLDGILNILGTRESGLRADLRQKRKKSTSKKRRGNKKSLKKHMKK